MMELTPEPYEEIKPYLPGQRGNVKLSNRKVLNGILYVAEQGCKWRGLPGRFGKLAYNLQADEPRGQNRGIKWHIWSLASKKHSS